MIRPDIVHEQRALSEALDDYVRRRKPAIQQKNAEVASQGPLGAAGTDDQIANARITTYAEALFLEATSRSDDKAPINFLSAASGPHALCAGSSI